MKLVFNRQARLGEVFIPADAHPNAIRPRIDAELGIVRESGEITARLTTDRTLVTYSPVAVDYFTRGLRGEGERPIREAYYHRDGYDHRVVDFMDEARLVYYDLGELYRDGELDQALDRHLGGT